MKKTLRSFILLILSLATALPTVAQERNVTLNVTVTTDTGDDLTGQLVKVQQTDYQLNYSPVALNAAGQCSLKIYAGNHSVSVDRDGYQPATTTFSVDENAASKDITLRLTEKTRTPFSLQATLSMDAYTGNNQVDLTWNTEKPAFFDDFESYAPFAITFGQWTGIDGDHIAAAPLNGDYPNSGVMQYAQIMNPLAVTPMWWYDYPVLRPYSGKQYVGFVRTVTGEANNDWLISPEITVGTDNILSFLAKAADRYPEKFIVYITTHTDAPTADDFTPLTTGNYESVDYKGWKQQTYDLAQYAGKKVKIAIRYISEANYGGAFMLMVDDFYVGQPNYDEQPAQAPRLRQATRGTQPAHSPANPNETFDILMDGEKVGYTDNYSYTLHDVPTGNHTFGVKAKYLAAESETVTTTLDVSNQDYATLTLNAKSDSKLPADGAQLNILSIDNGQLYTVTVANGKAAMKALHKGRYLISLEAGAFQAINKEIDLQQDTSLDFQLEDNVLTPYNITADITKNADGTANVALRWNRVLGFTDSFESSDDFATGEIGEWTSIDRDQMPVYPIALGNQSNIISFPGSGTAASPTAIAPMVFNGWKTTPAMLPTDPAMQAPDGNKFVIFFSPQRAQADKWLISPLIDIYDNYQLEVTAKSYDPTYPETFIFAVSEGSDNPDDFTALSSAERMPSEEWTQYTTSLKDYAGKKVRIGIHYTSYDTFFAQLDNVKVKPEDDSKANIDYGNVICYYIYLDGQQVGESATADFSLKGLAEGNHTIGIEAVYKNAVSDIAYYDLTVTAIGTVKTEAIPASAKIYNTAGQQLDGPLQSLPKGVYVVRYGNTAKKIQK